MIYLIATADRQFCKIGKAIAPHDRLATLQTASPFELELLATRALPNDFERQCHEAFATDRVRGEWFSFSDELLDKFLALKHVPRDDEVPDKSEARGFLNGQSIEEFAAGIDEIRNDITRTIGRLRLALANGETPAGLARKAGLHRNALYGAAKPDWDPKVSTLEKIWPHLPA